MAFMVRRLFSVGASLFEAVCILGCVFISTQPLCQVSCQAGPLKLDMLTLSQADIFYSSKLFKAWSSGKVRKEFLVLKQACVWRQLQAVEGLSIGRELTWPVWIDYRQGSRPAGDAEKGIH